MKKMLFGIGKEDLTIFSRVHPAVHAANTYALQKCPYLKGDKQPS